MVFRIRRVVTGHDRSGKSVFIMDGLAPNFMEMASMPGVVLTDLWRTRTSPASNEGEADAAEGTITLEPPREGTILRLVEFPPDRMWRDSADAATAFQSIGAGHAPDHGSGDAMMHATATVDYIIVLKGEIYAIMDDGETLLKAGDILIQRGTNHSWSVRGDEPCLVAAILVGAEPIGRLARNAPRGGKAKTRTKGKAAGRGARKAVPRKAASAKPAPARKGKAKTNAKTKAKAKTTGRKAAGKAGRKSSRR